MTGPVTETVLIAAIVAFSVVVVGVAYLVYLARLGKPIELTFSGYGVNLSVGQTTIAKGPGQPVLEQRTSEMA